MKSHEVFKDAFEKSSPKAVASDLGVSLSLVYKWAQEQSDYGSGSRNPLDRLLEIYEHTEHLPLIEWLCHRAGGYYVKNTPSICDNSQDVLPATNEIVGQFSELLARISKAALDQSITSEEAEEIRESWDHLKSFAEGFVCCCEQGNFEIIREAAAKLSDTRTGLH